MTVMHRSIAIVTLSPEGLQVARRLTASLDNCTIYVHEVVTTRRENEVHFKEVARLTVSLFQSGTHIVFVLPTGVAVRAIAPLIRHKKEDPAIVVVDVGARFAISLLSGHEGGANLLCLEVGNALGAEPIITTTTEAKKCLIVGIGCRRGTSSAEIETAVAHTLANNGLSSSDVRLFATADIKASEPGLIDAAKRLGVMLRCISSAEINACAKTISHSPFVLKKVNLPGVAEPAALLAGRKTVLIVPKQKFARVTVAIAKENCF